MNIEPLLTIVVTNVFLFLPESVAVAIHVFHPGPAKLIGCEVSFPVTWFFEGEGTTISGRGLLRVFLSAEAPCAEDKPWTVGNSAVWREDIARLGTRGSYECSPVSPF